MITSKAQKPVQLPHEEGQWIEVRMPSFRILQQARAVKSQQAVSSLNGVTPELLASLQSVKANGNGNGAMPDEPEDPRAAYDEMTLLAACVLSWSYPEDVTPANIAELDEETVSVIMAALLPGTNEVEEKNGFGRYIRP